MDKKELSDMRVFPIIEGLEELEKKEKWEEARVILYDLWSADKENLDFFMRLSSECWFLVAEWEVEKTNGLDWDIRHLCTAFDVCNSSPIKQKRFSYYKGVLN